MNVKICCIASPEEARMAIEAGARALGLVGKMPSGPGPIPDERIAEIAAQVPPTIHTFLLTSETEADAIIAHYQRTQTTTIQLVDAVERVVYKKLRNALPTVQLVQVLHVQDEDSIAEAQNIAPQVDALLLDSGSPNNAVKILGGTGKAHDWNISRRIVESVEVPVYLAGGLRAENVAQAIQQVQPYGLDLCTGVRTNGKLDKAKLAAFFVAVRAT